MPFSAIFLQASDHRQHAAQRRPAGTGFPQRGARGDQPVFLRACLPPEPEPRPEQPRVRQPRHAGGVTIGCLQWSARVVSHGHDPPWQTPCSPLLATGRAPAQQLVVAAKVEYNDPKSTDFFVCLFVCFRHFLFTYSPPPFAPGRATVRGGWSGTTRRHAAPATKPGSFPTSSTTCGTFSLPPLIAGLGVFDLHRPGPRVVPLPELRGAFLSAVLSAFLSACWPRLYPALKGYSCSGCGVREHRG